MLNFQVKDLGLTDKNGILTSDIPNLNSEPQYMIMITNLTNQHGNLIMALIDADIFVGFSPVNILTTKMIQTMNANPIVFVMANPVPETMSDLAIEFGVAVIGAGRSDLPNLVNNVLVFQVTNN